jgi:hypothetical protein
VSHFREVTKMVEKISKDVLGDCKEEEGDENSTSFPKAHKSNAGG